jgi:hypothetical protein
MESGAIIRGDEYLISFYVGKDNPKKQFLTISEA